MDAGSDDVQDVLVEKCSSAIAPALPYYRPSMDICVFDTSAVPGGRMSREAWMPEATPPSTHNASVYMYALFVAPHRI